MLVARIQRSATFAVRVLCSPALFPLDMRRRHLCCSGAVGFAVTLTSVIVCSLAADVVLKPPNTTRPQLGMVFLQGADIAPEQYIPLARAIQNSSNYSLWVGIPEFTFNTPESVEVSGRIKNMIASLHDAGMMNTTRIFFAAHSLGGNVLQEYLFGERETGFAQVLMGSYLLRKYRDETYPISTLTIGGELDGLCRVTRIMESFYHSVIKASNRTKAVTNFPVVTVAGMTHMQFASGDPPPMVKERDLRPEISEAQAHTAVASLVNTFISLHLGDPQSLSVLSKAVETTELFMQPIITAFELEGYYNFKPPCNSQPPSSCLLGSMWSSRAQEIMGGLKEAWVNNTDQFHPVYQLNSVHFPHISNNCSSPTHQCVLQTGTVTQNVYDELDDFDTGFVPISASEMRVKMSSRQAIMESAGYRNVNFNTSDGFSICKVINEESYNSALKNASNTTAARFQKFGEPYVMGDDEDPYNIGPVWILNPLKYKKTVGSTGNDVVEIRSPMLRTPLDFYIKVIAGFHYCKLLSPARAMEWIYVDGLRDHYNIKKQRR